MDKRKNPGKAYAFALMAIICWSTVASAFKIALKELNFMHLLLISNLTAILATFLILVINGKFNKIFNYNIRYHSRSVLLGFLNPFLYYIILFKAYSLLPAQIAQPLNFTWPVILTLLSIPLLRQKISAKNILALLVSFTGVFFISAQGNLINYKIIEPLGIFLALISSVIWSLFWILNMKDKRDDEIKLFFNFLFSGIYIVITCIIFSDFNFSLTVSFYAAIYSGIFEMGITFILWLKALQLSKTTDRVTNLVYIAPFLSLILIHYVLKEDIFFTSIIGLILIVLGIIIQRIRHQ
ncbi:MAG: DMT family transporter [Bacteroidales bacterium]|nr:MAG: DMT family transporter [Bacteroidales bacterium]